MYLAEHTIDGRINYVIRDSRYDPGSNCWLSRDLYNLGSSPWDYIIYPGGNAFYIDERISEQLEAQNAAYDLSELEELLWGFIRKEIRQKLEPFRRCGRRTGRGIEKRENHGKE